MAASLAAVPGRAAQDVGLAFGRRVGDAILAARHGDGSALTANYVPAAKPGVWRPTPPALAPPLGAHWGSVRPFLLVELGALAPPPPPSMTSAQYARDFAEVRSVGAKASKQRTPDQTEASVFWTGFAPHIWSSVARQALAGPS